MIGRTNSSQSDGLRATDAVLLVIAPANSTVTISKSGISKSDLGHENALDTSLYDYYFIIHSSQFDSITPWTVTATLGSDTASDTVIIDSADEYDITLNYSYYIVKNGELINTLKSKTNITVSQESGYVKVLSPTNTVGLAVTDPITDVSQYTKIVCETVGSNSRSWNSGDCPSFGYAYIEPSVNTSTGAVSNDVGLKKFTVGSNNYITADTYELAFTPSTTNYLWIDVSGLSSFQGRVDLYNFYFTK